MQPVGEPDVEIHRERGLERPEGAEAHGEPSFTDLNNGGISGATTATLTIDPVTSVRMGYYRVRVTDSAVPAAQRTSDAARLDLSPATCTPNATTLCLQYLLSPSPVRIDYGIEPCGLPGRGFHAHQAISGSASIQSTWRLPDPSGCNPPWVLEAVASTLPEGR